MNYTVQQRANCTCWYTSSNSVISVQRKFRAQYGKNVRVPSSASIKGWHSKFLETGSVLDAKRNREKSSTSAVKQNAVLQHFSTTPISSLRKCATSVGISHMSVQRIMKEERWHPYKIQTKQLLYDEDKAFRVAYAENQLRSIAESPGYLDRLFFSDESHFSLYGTVHRHNMRYWSDANPHWYSESPLHCEKTTAWAAIGSQGIIGPFFFRQTINKDRYLDMLQNEFYPIANTQYPDLIFMQDGAPPHWGINVRQWLETNFEGRWIGRGSPSMTWPSRSPDITPCDFFLWGYVKERVYNVRPSSLEDLENKIRQVMVQIPNAMLVRVMQNYVKRLNQLIAADGEHIEVQYYS